MDNLPEIRRHRDGSIDVNHYIAEARVARAAYFRQLFRRKRR